MLELLLALCENETQHKHKEFATSVQLKHLLQIPGVSEHWNKMADSAVDFEAYVDVRFHLA